MQVCYCLHVQQRLLREEWPIRLAEHSMARTVTVGSLNGRGHEGQVLFNGLRVRMVINTGKQQGKAVQPGGMPSRPHRVPRSSQTDRLAVPCSSAFNTCPAFLLPWLPPDGSAALPPALQAHQARSRATM